MGTDTLALACILGGAAVAGGVTMAMEDEGSQVDFGCSAVAIESTARVALSVGSIVVAPSVETLSDCDDGARVQARHAVQVRRSVDRARRQVDRARARVERVERTRVRDVQERLENRAVRRQEMQLELEGLEQLLGERLGTKMEILQESLEPLAEMEFEFEFEGLEELLEERLGAEMEILQESLEPLREMEFEFQGLEEQLHLELEGLDELLEGELEGPLEAELQRLLERLERIGEVRGG